MIYAHVVVLPSSCSVVEEEGSVFARRHYSQAKVDGVVYKLNDTACVQACVYVIFNFAVIVEKSIEGH